MQNWRSRGHITHAPILEPYRISKTVEDRHFKYDIQIDCDENWRMYDRLSPKLLCSGSCGLLIFWQVTDNIPETIQKET